MRIQRLAPLITIFHSSFIATLIRDNALTICENIMQTMALVNASFVGNKKRFYFSAWLIIG